MAPVWSRRRLLQAGALAPFGLLAGCSLGEDDVPTPTGASTDSPTATPAPPTLRFSVESLDAPRELRIAITNESDEPFVYRDGFYPFEQQVVAGSVYLVPDNTEGLTPTNENYENLDVPLVPETPTSGCLTARYHNILISQPEAIYRLEPGEMWAETYTLVDGPSEGCYPRGWYEFGDRRTIDTESGSYVVDNSFTVRVLPETLEIEFEAPTIRRDEST